MLIAVCEIDEYTVYMHMKTDVYNVDVHRDFGIMNI